MNTVLITVVCPDRTGLVAAIAGCLFDLGINFSDTTFAVLGGAAELTAVCEAPEGLTREHIADQLAATSGLEDAEIRVTPFNLSPTHGPTASVTHQVTIEGEDHPGLIARLTETLVDFNANIVYLTAERIAGSGNPRYRIRLSVWIPQARARACLSTLANTASGLGMSCESETV